MQVSIQTARSKQLKGIHELVLEWGYSVSEPETLEWLKASANSSNHQLFVAVSDDSVLGWIAVEKRLSLGQGFISEITGLVVRSSHRRSGIGLLLVNAAEDWSRNLGLTRVLVRSNVRRLESHKFYPSIGFDLTKTTNVYTKELNSPNRPRKTGA
ncbi:GNAT family N-acetyltransferase [Marinobacter sp. CHS3-4]|uniref:GNAT family N-acetyltransferase n=1 Tax=Marinobacter sp. CHS3-4 TaxID=3045174 RepID=UPI0024B56669|nr:GNAT family N-acetyltransferase [Marinobacter sp. CHS3-4]MDI9246567.1 GNAT family N-acetyltransferase [Marinobacter sp. CHS3-4]